MKLTFRIVSIGRFHDDRLNHYEVTCNVINICLIYNQVIYTEIHNKKDRPQVHNTLTHL